MSLATIQANLSNWREHHSIALQHYDQKIYSIRDLEDVDYHLISFDGFPFAKQILIKFSIKKAEDCNTNLAIYIFGDVCVAVIAPDSLDVLFGEAKQRPGSISATKRVDGWVDMAIEIVLDMKSIGLPIYLGCSQGHEGMYKGFDRNQFYIEDSVTIDILKYPDYPEINNITSFRIVDVGAAGGIQSHWSKFINYRDKITFYLFDPD